MQTETVAPTRAVSRGIFSSQMLRTLFAPLGQLAIWTVGTAVVLSLVVLLLALIFRTSSSGVDRFTLVLSILPQVIVDSMVLGFVYAMIALGYTMVYGVLEFINFAHSEIFMIGAVVGAEVLISLSEAKALENFNPLLLILLIIAAGMAVSGLVAVVVERVAYRPLRNAPRLVPLISAIGVSFFLQDLVRMLESIWRNAFYRTYPDVPSFSQRISFGDTLDVSYKSIIVVVAAIVMLLALNYLVGATKIGKSIRAVAQNRATASLMGIDVDRAIALTFLVGGALGGAAGVLYGLRFSTINPYTGFIPGIKAFTAAVLGGIGNITGAMLGGIVLGFLETFGASYLSIFTEGAFGAEYKDILAFGILIIVLIFRPKGLLGEVVGERA